eukprot:2699708-Alexandrium_andersonii.AAC.1
MRASSHRPRHAWPAPRRRGPRTAGTGRADPAPSQLGAPTRRRRGRGRGPGRRPRVPPRAL